MFRGLSLASKSMLLFGGAAVLVVLAALIVPGWRMVMLIDNGQLEVSRHMVSTWLEAGQSTKAKGDFRGPMLVQPAIVPETRIGISARELPVPIPALERDEFLTRAVEYLRKHPQHDDYQRATWTGLTRDYRYVRAERATNADGSRSLVSLVELSRRSIPAAREIVLNTSFLLTTGLFLLIATLLMLWFILQRIMLGPVHDLKEVARRVREGNLAIRSDVRTGDEFEELADTLNTVLADLQVKQDRLRASNSALDDKVIELSQTNSALHEAARVKGEFLANVSHELRTPMNSIIGFAELLRDATRSDLQKPDPPADAPKRLRYAENILLAGRNLLALINSLLEMARIEAGKVDLRIEPVNLRDACEGLIGLITPLADKKGVTIALEFAEDVPVVRTDPRKFHQIIFNFLSNAVKFLQPLEATGRHPHVTLRAERLPPASDAGEQVRVSVIDNGPGIAKEDQEKIFDKFYQAQGGHTREQTGTGLGLAIAKELAHILRCEIQLVSDAGRGSMFSLIMPVSIAPPEAEASALESRFRGTLESGREWNQPAASARDH